MTFQLDLEQLRKQAKERMRERRAAGQDAKLADVQFELANLRGTFGGPSHGEGVTAIHLAAQAERRDAVVTLLELGADPLIRDSLHDGNALGWARVGGHTDLADVLP